MKKIVRYNKNEFMRIVVELFATKGYAGSSLSDIAKKNGFNKRVSLDHHRSKKEMLKDILYYVHNYENETLFNSQAAMNLNKFCNSLKDYIVSKPLASSLVVSLYNELLLDNETQAFMDSYFSRYKEAFRRFLPQAYSSKYKQHVAEQLTWQFQGLLIAYRIYKDINPIKVFINQFKMICKESEGYKSI